MVSAGDAGDVVLGTRGYKGYEGYEGYEGLAEVGGARYAGSVASAASVALGVSCYGMCCVCRECRAWGQLLLANSRVSRVSRWSAGQLERSGEWLALRPGAYSV